MSHWTDPSSSDSCSVLFTIFSLLLSVESFTSWKMNKSESSFSSCSFSNDIFVSSSSVLKAMGSALAIACSVTMYHRSLRSFLVDKSKQQVTSSVVYFLWNLLLIASRLTALALFASVLPCFILTHFICSWIIFFFFAWRSQTSFMESTFGEWLYRATVGLIWYFDWFNVVDGKTRYRTLLYHGYILADISLLCGLYCWMKMSPEPPYLDTPLLNAIITAASVVGVYILGLFSKMIYYKCFHPNLDKVELKVDSGTDEIDSCLPPSNEEHSPVAMRVLTVAVDDVITPEPVVRRCNKRMRKLAENFYSWPASPDIQQTRGLG